MSVSHFRTNHSPPGFRHQSSPVSPRAAGRLFGWCFAVAAALMLLTDARTSYAWQNGTDSKPQPAARPSNGNTGGDESTSKPTGDTAIILDNDGNPVEIPVGPTWEEFLKFVRERGKSAATDLPDYYIARLQLTGEVNAEDSVASLDAEILVRVLTDKRAVDVPLRLTEATLRDHSYSGSGTLAFIPTDRNNGVVCRLAGKGEHSIRLKMLVTVRKSADTFRLQLSLPPSPQSELTLTVPRERIVVRGDTSGNRMIGSTQQDGTTRIRAFGLGTTLDLSWQELAARTEVRPEISTTTLVAAALEPDGASIEAEQTIVATRGNFDRLKIEIPAGFTLRSLTSPTHPEIQYEQPEFPRVVLEFPGPTSGPVKLTWSLYSVKPADGTGESNPAETEDDSPIEFEIQGFRVEEAGRHDGFLRVSVPEGFHLGQSEAQTPDQTRQLMYARVSAFQPELISRRSPGTEGEQLVWRILDPRFRAGFRLERIEPGYHVTPRFTLQFNDRIVELTASFDVSVYRGSLRRLDLLWPDFDTQKWRVEVAGSPVDVELQLPNSNGAGSSEQPAAERPATEDRITMLLTEARSRTHDNWTIELTCRAPVPEGVKSFPLTLPQVDVPIERLRSPIVRVINEQNIESTLTAARGTVAHEVPDDAAEPVKSHLPANLQTRAWEIDSPSLQFDATVSAHEQEVSCDSYATLRYDDDHFEITQRLEYSVAYEPLSRVRIEIPTESAGEAISRAEFRLLRRGDVEPKKLMPIGAGLPVGETIQRSLQLPESLWGRFTIICEYSVPIEDLLTTSKTFVSNIPLIQSADAATETTRVEIQAPANIDMQLPAETWQPEVSVGRFPAWLAQGTQRRLQVTSKSSTGRASERFSVRYARLQTALFPTGSSTQAAYQVEGDTSWLTLTFPPDCNLNSIVATWDGQPLDPGAIREVPDSLHTLRFDLNVDGNATSHVLEIEYQSRDRHDFGPLSTLTVHAPEFSSGVQLSEAVWEVTLPDDQYVLVYPENWMPQMRWQRDGIVWRRKPTDRDRQADWPTLESTGTRPSVPLFGGSLTTPYRFSAFGHHQSLVIRSMSRPAIVMTGTGLSLAIGLILLRIPATRHVLTLLTATFAISVIGLWHLESLQLLAQPAVFGLLLAVVGTLIDVRARQRMKSSYVAYSSPSDFLVPGSSVVELMQEETKTSPRRTPDATGA